MLTLIFKLFDIHAISNLLQTFTIWGYPCDSARHTHLVCYFFLFFACSERISGSSFSDEGCLRFPLGFRFQENPTLLMCLLPFFIFFAIPVSSSCYCLGLREYPGRPMCWSPEGTLVGLTAHLFLCGRWGWNSPSPRDCTGAYCSRTARGSSFGLPWIRQLCVPTTLSDNTCIEVERDCTCY